VSANLPKMELAIITGAGSGIGAALAEALSHASPSLHLLLVGRRSDALALTASRCAPRSTVLPLDITAPTAPAALGDAIVASSLRVRFLVHCAGTLGEIAALCDISHAAWQTALSTNATAPLFLSQATLPLFVPKGGRILHISSGAALRPVAGWGAYCASKAALHAVYGVLAEELRGRGIAVGSARPGVVDTAMQERIREEGKQVAAFSDHARFVALKGGVVEGGAAPGPAPPPSGALDSAANVAAFLSWLLLSTGDSEFSASEWDIRDAVHHPRWALSFEGGGSSSAGGGGEEHFDVLTAEGLRTGSTAPRSIVHRQGLFHRAAHIWVLAPHTGEVLLQQRAACKDSWPSLLDCSAAGHVGAGEESLPSALRELEEEIGVAVPPTRLRFLFTHLERASSMQKGKPFFNNEFQDVYVLCLTREEREALAPERAVLREVGAAAGGDGAAAREEAACTCNCKAEVEGEEEAPPCPSHPPLTRFQLQASEVSAVQWRKWRDVEQRLRAKCASIVPWGEAPPPRGGAPSLQQLGDAIAELCEAYVAAELKAAVAVARDLAATVGERGEDGGK
jgi:benzil reductase ((S)-benzoin forming)